MTNTAFNISGESAELVQSYPRRQTGLREACSAPDGDGLPEYLVETYTWAYLNPRNVALLDRDLVVNAILWGNLRQLKQALLTELQPGIRVFQAAHVYGSMIRDVARLLGPTSVLDIIDVSPLQVANCRRKLREFPQARVRVADAVEPGEADYDAVSSFFLLHELPQEIKQSVVDSLLARVAPGGKAIFIDYHRPSSFHPLKPIMSVIFDIFEPFAKGLWHHEISELSDRGQYFTWRKETMFGGLYQKVVAVRNP